MRIGRLEVECRRDNFVQDGIQVSCWILGQMVGKNRETGHLEGEDDFRKGNSVCAMFLKYLWESNERYTEGS